VRDLGRELWRGAEAVSGDGNVTSTPPDPAYASMLNDKKRSKGGLRIEIVPRDQPGCIGLEARCPSGDLFRDRTAQECVGRKLQSVFEADARLPAEKLLCARDVRPGVAHVSRSRGMLLPLDRELE
jgi:hypothetical protein